MKRVGLALVAIAVAASPALADQPDKDWMRSSKVIAMLEAQGYKVVKIEADDGHWEGEATREGKTYDFHADPFSGKLTKLERDRD